MKKSIVLVVSLLVVIALVIWFEPTRVVVGWLSGEQFFDSRPTRYWIDALQSDDPGVSDNAEKKLAAGGARAASVLDEILREAGGNDAESSALRLRAADLLGDIGPDAEPYASTLLAMLDDPDPHVRSIAIRSLAKVNAAPDEAVPALIKRLEKDKSVEAARALSAFGQEAAPAIEPLTTILLDKKLDSEVRWNAARTLGKMREAGAPAIDVLAQCLKDEAPTVREHSAEALGDIGPPSRESVPALLEVLADNIPRVRRDAARSLGQIGNADPEVIQALQRLAKDDPDAEVKAFATNALKALDHSQAANTTG